MSNQMCSIGPHYNDFGAHPLLALTTQIRNQESWANLGI